MSEGKGKIRVAIVGVGNCASALVQGLEFYKDAEPGQRVPGLMHVKLGPYHVRDVEIVAAFDVDGKKVGKDVSEAIFTEPNNTIRFADVPPLGVDVRRAPTLDGLGHFYREQITESSEEPVDVAAVLRETRAQVVVNYLPVGSEVAAKHYAQAALEAGAGFVNCMPVFIASGRAGSRTPGSRSSATTSRARWDRPSSTACCPSCSRTAG
jgi:myo-inositol-1-phosphate synthase